MKKSSVLFILSFLSVLIVDQLSKLLARNHGMVAVNNGISFGVSLFSTAWLFLVLTCIVLVALFLLFRQYFVRQMAIFGGLCGAALSNVLDRFLLGGVQDFLPIPFVHLQNNIADWVIFLCLIWVGWKIYLSRTPTMSLSQET